MATRTDFIFGGRPEAGRAGQSPSRQLQQQQPSSSSSTSSSSAAVSSMTQPSYLAAARPPHSGAASAAAAGHWSVPPGTSHGARTGSGGGGGGPVNVASIRGTVSDQLLSFGRGLQRTRHAIIQAAAKRDRELRQAHSMQTRLKRANAILTAELIAVKEQLAQCKADKDVRAICVCVCCVCVVVSRGSSSGTCYVCVLYGCGSVQGQG